MTRWTSTASSALCRADELEIRHFRLSCCSLFEEQSHEDLLQDVKATLDIQFRRIAAIQAQLDLLLAGREQ